MTDIQRYSEIINDIEQWLETVVKYEDPLRETYADIDSYDAGSAGYTAAVLMYANLARKVQYHTYTGLEALRKARLNLEFFKTGRRNLKRIKLRNPRAYDRRYEAKLAECKTNKAAWEAVEAEYKDVFGEHKYSSYNSYQTHRSNRIKRRQLG